MSLSLLDIVKQVESRGEILSLVDLRTLNKSTIFGRVYCISPIHQPVKQFTYIISVLRSLYYGVHKKYLPL